MGIEYRRLDGGKLRIDITFLGETHSFDYIKGSNINGLLSFYGSIINKLVKIGYSIDEILYGLHLSKNGLLGLGGKTHTILVIDLDGIDMLWLLKYSEITFKYSLDLLQRYNLLVDKEVTKEEIGYVRSLRNRRTYKIQGGRLLGIRKEDSRALSSLVRDKIIKLEVC